MSFYKMQADRVNKLFGKYRNGRVLPVGGLLLAAGAISIFYSNCGNFSASKNSKSAAALINTEGESQNSAGRPPVIVQTGGESFYGDAAGAIIGNVERLVDNGSTLVLSGWACVVGSNTSAVLEVGASGGGSFGTTTAEAVRENAVKEACQSTTNNHGFSFEISTAQRNANDGKAPYVNLNGTAIPVGSNLIIKAVPQQPPPANLAGYLDAVTYQGDGSATLTGWACLTGTDEKVSVSIISDKDASFAAGLANSPAGLGVQAACASPTINHGFSINIPFYILQDAVGTKFRAQASGGGKTAYLNGEFPIKKPENKPVLPFTAGLPQTWTGPGGSTWNHSATLVSTSVANGAVFSIYSSSSNAGLSPSFLEQKNDITVTGNGCQDVGVSNRTSADGSNAYVVTVRACFTQVNNDKIYWDISFTHRTLNTTTNDQGGESASHGTISLRPPRN
jgi:hypothetical protein